MDTPRVLVIRTSRFLPVAVAEARQQWPSAFLRVLYQAGSEDDVRGCGVEPEPRLRLSHRSRLGAWSALRSGAFWHVLHWRPDHVLLQWWGREGRGHEAADRVALLLALRGFHVVLEDGTCFYVSCTERLARPLRTATRWLMGPLLVGVAAVLVVLATPGWWMARRREQRRMQGAG